MPVADPEGIEIDPLTVGNWVATMTSHLPVSPAAPVLRSTPDMEIVQVILYVGSVRKVDLEVWWSSLNKT